MVITREGDAMVATVAQYANCDVQCQFSQSYFDERHADIGCEEFVPVRNTLSW